jgi:phage terminase large subunit-like protein
VKASRLEALLQTENAFARENKLLRFYPDSGPLRRELYRKHLEFFRAGKEHRERCVIAANRVGKTEGMGGYETTLHLLGTYPAWWEGARFDHPVSAWAAGDTGKTTRDILQLALLGPVAAFGSGLIPRDKILRTTRKTGLSDAVDTVHVRHRSGGTSVLGFKSYEEGRVSFQGTAKHVIWLDEEPPMDVYTEALLRTMAAGSFQGGLVMCTFTPLQGMSDVVCYFMGIDQAEEK